MPGPRAWLADFDVVYATHITRDGSIPGNLFPTPGARVRLSVTWLDAEQLAAMHATEIAGEHYVFGRLGAVELAIDRKSVVEGKSVSVRVDLGGRLMIKTTHHI